MRDVLHDLLAEMKRDGFVCVSVVVCGLQPGQTPRIESLYERVVDGKAEQRKVTVE